MRNSLLLCLSVSWMVATTASAEDALTREQAAAALRKAVRFFREHVSASGGYVWRYSADLARHEGEGRGSSTTAWVQPPGTPTVGQAFLFAYASTLDEEYLQAARETAHALVRGQLESGGWDYRIEYDPSDRRRYRYRVDEDRPEARNVTTLDDDTTQSALRFLMRVDRALQFKDEQIHASIEYGLERLLAAQYPNGAFPQRFSAPPDPQKHPVLPASYPESWSRTHPDHDYRSYYTFNDNTIADTIETLFQAARTYDKPRYRRSAESAGGFILLAQMPAPQPAWAQQYNARMHPAWARRFEPPSITGGESQGVIRVLLQLYRQTGDKKYLEPIPKALDYLEKSRLSNGQLARFYELRTNRPLYFTRQYQLTYSDDDLPTHYGFKVSSNLYALRVEYQRLLRTRPDALQPAETDAEYEMSPALKSAAAKAVKALDKRGAWVERGRLRSFEDLAAEVPVIDTRTFVSNVRTLSRFLGASR